MATSDEAQFITESIDDIDLDTTNVISRNCVRPDLLRIAMFHLLTFILISVAVKQDQKRRDVLVSLEDCLLPPAHLGRGHHLGRPGESRWEAQQLQHRPVPH